MRINSIFKTCIVYFVLGASPVFFFYELGLHSFLKNKLQTRFDQELVAKVQMLITLTKLVNGHVELDLADEFSPEFSRFESPEYFQIWYPDGRILERSISLGTRDLRKIDAPSKNPFLANIQLTPGGKCRVVQVSFLPQDESNDIEGSYSIQKEAFVICLAKNRESFDLFLSQIQMIIVASFLVFMALLYFALRFAIQKGLEPLNEVRRQVAKLDHHNLHSTIHLNQKILELDPIVYQLNSMLKVIDEAMKREKSFTSNVSHELRTPISELRCIAEVALKTQEPNDDSRAYFQEVLDISNEMNDVVRVLLDLSRCDNQSIPISNEPFNLVAHLEKCLDRVKCLFSNKTFELKLNNIKNAWIESDPGKLDQILFNIIRNAASHSPDGSRISIEFVVIKDNVLLKITNPAPNLKEADLPFIFDRFWQKDTARTGGGSVGLGLSLVKTFSDLLSISLKAELIQDNYFCLILEIPVRFKN